MIAQKINKWLKGVMAVAMTLTVATSCHDRTTAIVLMVYM